MRIKIITILMLVSLLVEAQDMFYYYEGNKISLQLDKSCVNIRQKSGTDKLPYSVLSLLDMEQAGNNQNSEIKKYSFKSVLEEADYLNIINTLKETVSIENVFPYLKRGDDDAPIGTSDIFYVKLKEAKDTLLFKQLLKEKSLNLVKQVSYMPLWYVLSIQKSGFKNSIEAANYMYETGNFEKVDPAFMFKIESQCTSDPMFYRLWGLKNDSGVDINICKAWEITKGKGVKVAVVDTPIDIKHRDLAENIYTTYDAMTGGGTCYYEGGGLYHGTHITGIIAAVENDLQVVGVAPQSKIMGIGHKMYYDEYNPQISSQLADGISWAWQNGADVINNSWGVNKNGGEYNIYHSEILEEAIISAMTQGRNGKGSIVVFAAGNTTEEVYYPGCFDERVLVVGSIDSRGDRAQQSASGNSLDLVAPGVDIYSTIPNNVVNTMTGTSMAAPHVAGVAALVLSVNSTLTRKQVCDIIESTTKGNSDNYPVSPERPNGEWNKYTGYGLVDAYAAVQAACTPIDIVDQPITANTAITGYEINVRNVTVQPNAKLVLDALYQTIINGPFETKAGAELEVK